MAKRAPFVSIRTDIRKDERVNVIADIGGYNRHEAMGRLLDLWAWCSDRRLSDAPGDCDGYAVPDAVVKRFLGKQGVAAILGDGCDELALGERRDDGLIYLRGTSETVTRLRSGVRGAVAGGVARDGAPRDSEGQYVSGDTIIQRQSTPDSTLSPAPVQPSSSESPLTTHHVPDPEEISLPRAIPPSTEPAPPPQTTTLQQRQAAKAGIWRELAAARDRAAAQLGIKVQPLMTFDPGERALASRLALALDLDGLEAVVEQARHVIAVAECEATRDDNRSVQWLTGVIFEEKNWRTAAGKSLDDAKRIRAGPGRRGDREQPSHLTTIRKVPQL